ncbi:putative uncharacterized protein DDB_G0282133 [Hydractinia symbiolongicarpus]|uniref:putative uncharacterized protein DDB_G0282133 n=1 Tax=Hydractinia symbiolongicarpus TaxID=13093 RepID=UPI00254AA39A|nr:putative uncharacterized protein DDB_G0282133 [Hydractinia symbiolongicarpus]
MGMRGQSGLFVTLSLLLVCNGRAFYMDEDDTDEKLEETKINKNKDLPTAKKISGYFIPPQTGEYKFYSSCGAACKIYLSGRDSPNGRRIISQNEKTKPGDFERYADQASHLIYLEKGRKYFMKATTKSTEESRDPQLSIGVVLPDDVKLFPISKTFMKDVSIEKTPLVSADTVERAENVRTKVMDKPKLFERSLSKRGKRYRRKHNSRRRLQRKLEQINHFIKVLERTKDEESVFDLNLKDFMKTMHQSINRYVPKSRKHSNPVKEVSTKSKDDIDSGSGHEDNERENASIRQTKLRSKLKEKNIYRLKKVKTTNGINRSFGKATDLKEITTSKSEPHDTQKVIELFDALQNNLDAESKKKRKNVKRYHKNFEDLINQINALKEAVIKHENKRHKHGKIKHHSWKKISKHPVEEIEVHEEVDHYSNKEKEDEHSDDRKTESHHQRYDEHEDEDKHDHENDEHSHDDHEVHHYKNNDFSTVHDDAHKASSADENEDHEHDSAVVEVEQTQEKQGHEHHHTDSHIEEKEGDEKQAHYAAHDRSEEKHEDLTHSRSVADVENHGENHEELSEKENEKPAPIASENHDNEAPSSKQNNFHVTQEFENKPKTEDQSNSEVENHAENKNIETNHADVKSEGSAVSNYHSNTVQSNDPLFEKHAKNQENEQEFSFQFEKPVKTSEPKVNVSYDNNIMAQQQQQLTPKEGMQSTEEQQHAIDLENALNRAGIFSADESLFRFRPVKSYADIIGKNNGLNAATDQLMTASTGHVQHNEMDEPVVRHADTKNTKLFNETLNSEDVRALEDTLFKAFQERIVNKNIDRDANGVQRVNVERKKLDDSNTDVKSRESPAMVIDTASLKSVLEQALSKRPLNEVVNHMPTSAIESNLEEKQSISNSITKSNGLSEKEHEIYKPLDLSNSGKNIYIPMSNILNMFGKPSNSLTNRDSERTSAINYIEEKAKQIDSPSKNYPSFDQESINNFEAKLKGKAENEKSPIQVTVDENYNRVMENAQGNQLHGRDRQDLSIPIESAPIPQVSDKQMYDKINDLIKEINAIKMEIVAMKRNKVFRSSYKKSLVTKLNMKEKLLSVLQAKKNEITRPKTRRNYVNKPK